ncbi:uncharacterized protein e(y)3 isoform X2 [Venturia canescens]|uniref:uncharacterized protein e(y)3 isoform X2 n=1 Tax=Venturia canescens TaxID=32260 RepID=UPI001C9C4683|nr:uncharacterized protein LOC122416370 isoform X2 [Venturia canescens]
MSEGDKMGLFGSKDENNEENPEDNNTTAKSQENSSERFAPYNIDSDSETYDTEALSIMDINDIIGVQTDTPEDSTLESEFAALSEVITDSKDDFVLQLDKSGDSKDNPSSRNDQHCSKDKSEVEVSCPKGTQNSTSLQSMSKSLQLIGEAYISEESQEADSDIAEEKTPKESSVPSENVKVSLSPSKLLEPDIGSKEKESTDNVLDPLEEVSVEGKISIEKKELKTEIARPKNSETPSEPSSSTEIIKSIDSIDAAVIKEPKTTTKDSDTEKMDIDSIIPSEEPKTPIKEAESHTEPEDGNDQVKNVLPEEDCLPKMNAAEGSRDLEEPMEVDEPTEILTISSSDPGPEKIAKIISEAGHSSEKIESTAPQETSDIRAEVNEKLSEDIVDVKFSLGLETIREESNVEEEKLLDSVEVESEPQKDKSGKFEVGESEKMTPGESSGDVIKEKTLEGKDPEVVMEKQIREMGRPLQSSTNIEEVHSVKNLLEDSKGATEPMEIDHPEQEEIEKPIGTFTIEKSPVKVELTSKQTVENQLNEEAVEKAQETRAETSEINEPMKRDKTLDNEKEKILNDSQSIQKESKSSEIVEVVPVPSDVTTPNETFDRVTEDEKMEVDGTVKKTSNEKNIKALESDCLPEITKTVSLEKEISKKMTENQCGIDTVDDTKIAPLKLEEIVEIASESNILGIAPDEQLAESIEKTGNNENKSDNINTEVDRVEERQENENKVDKDEKNITRVDENEGNKNEIDKTEEQRNQVDLTKENKNETTGNGDNSTQSKGNEEIKNQVDQIQKSRNEIIEKNPNKKLPENNANTTNQIHEIESINPANESPEEMEKIFNEIQVPESSDVSTTKVEAEVIVQETSDIPKENSEIEKIESKENEDTSNYVENMETSSKTEKIDDTERIEGKEISESTQSVKCPDQGKKETEDPKLVEVSGLNIVMNTESLIEEKKESSSCLEPTEMIFEKTENEDELKDSICPRKPEVEIGMETSTEEEKADVIDSETPESSYESLNTDENKNDASPKEEEKEDSNLINIVTEEESENSEKFDATGNEGGENISESVKTETNEGESSNFENVESINKNENNDLVASISVEFSSEISKKNDIEKSVEEKLTANENEESNKTEIKSTVLCHEKNATETSSMEEEKKLSRPKLPSEVSSTSENLEEFEAKEDEIENEMTLSVNDPEMFETGENFMEDNSRTRQSPERMFTEQAMGTVEKIETNLSGDTEKKSEDLVRVENRLEQSEENTEAIQEKSLDENLKDMLSSSSSVCVGQIFNDDEQSQSTQEMMESILETNKGNINKILDDQEASDFETAALNNVEKLPEESEDMLNKALADPMGTQNIDSLEGLLDLDLMPENDESNLKSVEPIVHKVMQEGCDDIETIEKSVDVGLLMEENDTIENPVQNENYESTISTKTLDNDSKVIGSSVDDLMSKSNLQVDQDSQDNSHLTDKDLEAFDLASVVTNPLDNVDPSEDTKINLAEDLLRQIAVDGERKITLTEKLLLDDDIQEQDLLLSASIEQPTKMEMSDGVFLPVEAGRDIELAEDISIDMAVPDQVLNDVAAEIENLPASSEISELESAVKFLQESEEQDIESSLVLSPKLVEDVVDEIVENADVGIFANEADICEDPSELVAELESIIPDPIAISEAEIINEAAKLEIERKTQLSGSAKLLSPAFPKGNDIEEEILQNKIQETSGIAKEQKIPETSSESQEIEKTRGMEIIEHEPLKKSVPIPKTSILEERLKIPPKIEIPVGEVTRMCESPSTPKTSLLIQRDARASNLMKQLESPKATEKSDLKIVDTPRKDSEKHDFENVGSPRIILKIAKSAIADCSEPRSPKSPKIRSATNSPNPDDSPGQKLGKIKLKLSKGGHPSIISNENVEEQCGQWHTEGSSSLSPLGMKIKFSKIPDSPSHQTDKHETDETREQSSKHKFEEAKRTDSPLGMKIKLSKTGEPTIVQHETKDPGTKHKDKFDIQQDSPKRAESSIGMKIKLSKSGDASIIQPDKQDTSEEHKDGSSRVKDKLENSPHHEKTETPRRTESPLGMKFKLFKTGDASIVQTESPEENQQEIQRTDSPVGKKSKQQKSRTPLISSELEEESKEKLEIEAPRRTESPLGMKIKLSKRGDPSIILNEETREALKQKPEVAQETTSDGVSKIKAGKATLQVEATVESESVTETSKRVDPSIGMKIKLSKSGDASIVHTEKEDNSEETRDKEKSEVLQENTLKIDTPIGMKIKLSKTGDASIIPSASAKKTEDVIPESEKSKIIETAVKTKVPKVGDAPSIDADKKDKSLRRKDSETPLEMKIKLSKTGHPTIVACENYSESPQRSREVNLENPGHVGPSKQSLSPQDTAGMKLLKSMQGGNLHGARSELTIEPVQLQARKSELPDDSVSKRKDITISPVESKKAKLEAKLSHILPEVTIQPIVPREPQQQMLFETKSGSISRQQMNVISQEISITQVRPSKPMDLSMTEKFKSILTQNAPPPGADCEIIEHRPELIIVNENSNSSQDVMIIEEVPAIRPPEVKVPKKRGRPRRNPLPIILAKPAPLPPGAVIEPIGQKDPLALDDISHMGSHIDQQMFPPVESEVHGRPKRTCRNQKSYAPPRRGRGRGGRGKRKMEMNRELAKRPRIEQDLDMIERSTTALITIHDPPSIRPQNLIDPSSEAARNTSELYKALRQPTMDRKMPNALARNEVEQAVSESCNNPGLMKKNHLESLMDVRIMSHLDGVINTSINKTASEETFEKDRKMLLVDISSSENQTVSNLIPEALQNSGISTINDKIMGTMVDDAKNNKNTSGTIDHENWLTPSAKKLCDTGRNEGNISNVQVIDEETRMSAESGSRSQTPAKNMSLQAPETIVNEESQGSVLSTATTESEKVKVKIRRMEINFDPDEGPFTVDKVAEYDWPLDPTKKNETFMIQEQISHYLGVKSFKRKYPDLKRRMVEMEERNFLRENGLVSEAMCDMGLTAVLSSEVLDVMCSDFPDQYEEYRKHIREKQMKEHLKKQKELTAAANAEKNRIDLAEMAVQSALSWNIGLNKARRESRKCSLDLQTFTIHVPKKQQKVEEESGSNHYPVALIPGQYTDYYREYTPAELRYYPLNTVLYGPMRPNERKFDSQSEGSQSDSDSDSSSDDSSSTSSEGTQDTEASQSTMDDVDAELSRQKEDIKSIKCKMCLKHLNKFSRPEVLIQCGTCNGYVHPSCIDLTLDMVPHIQAYAWQCTDCKTCAQCHDPADEDKMLFCDMCDRGYHIYCVGLRRVPQGRWHCQECAVCASCGSREAGGTNSDRNSVAQWQHEYKKGDKNTRVYVSTLCVPCSKLCGEQGSDSRPEKLSV